MQSLVLSDPSENTSHLGVEVEIASGYAGRKSNGSNDRNIDGVSSEDDDNVEGIPVPPAIRPTMTCEAEYSREIQDIAITYPAHISYRKSVRFSDTNETFVVLSRRDILTSEKRQAWYRRSELKQAIQDNLTDDDEEEETDENHFFSTGNGRQVSSDKDCALASHRVRSSSVSSVPMHMSDERLPKLPNDKLLEFQRMFHRMMAVSLVLDEQARQRNLGCVVDQNGIAHKYGRHTSRSRQALFVAALLAHQKHRKSRKVPARGGLLEPRSAIC